MHPVQIPLLTPLRGLAALLVVLFHMSAFLPGLEAWVQANLPLVRHGYLAVDLFFLLSGCVIAHAYGHVFRAGWDRHDFRQFLVSRFARVYPLHFVVLMGLLALELAHVLVPAADPIFSSEHRQPASLLSNLLLVQALHLHPTLTWNMPAWSISTEWWVYFSFPLVAAVVFRAPQRRVGLVFVLALSCLAALSAREGNLDATYDYGLLRCLFEFTMGACLYRLAYRPEDGRFSRWLPPLALVFAGWAVANGGGPVRDVLAVLAFCVLLVVAMNARADSALNGRVLTWLGDISYSVYLLHFPFLLLVPYKVLEELHQLGVGPIEAPLTVAMAVVSSLALLLLTSHLSYRWVELPCRRWIKARFGKTVPRASAVMGEPTAEARVGDAMVQESGGR